MSSTDDQTSAQVAIDKENPLRIGICSLQELEERVNAFRTINQNSIKKRYILSREVIDDPNQKNILRRSSEIDIAAVKLLRRYFPGDKMIKIFQPDEGIVIMSSMCDSNGISFSMDLVTQVLNIGGGSYEAFIERTESFVDFFSLLKKALFPRILLIGYLQSNQLETEKINFLRSRKLDPFMRIIEVTHGVHKKEPYFPRLKQLNINPNDPHAWGTFILDVIREYGKSYFLDDIPS